MTYLNELLVEQRVAQLRRAGELTRPVGTPSPRQPRRSLRAVSGRALVRLGERLAQPAGTPATR
jgi:hypothetical protein